MCLAVIAQDAHPRFRLVVAANRDEFHARPAAPASWWDEGWLAGRDLSARGTWLGVARNGRWAFVTNVREPGEKPATAPSRGTLVTRILADRGALQPAMNRVIREGVAYNGFNLCAGDATSAIWGSNRAAAPVPLAAGVHGLSNASLDTAWPKVARTQAALAAWCDAGSGDFDALLRILADTTRATDAELPSTGIPVEWERILSAPFIVARARGYGTRCSTILAIDRAGSVRFIERSFDRSGRRTGDVDCRFELDATD